eukprot:305186-Pelagomonas_calceolata.AAC.1
MQRLNPHTGTELHTPHTQVKLFQDWGWWPRGSGVQQQQQRGAATKGARHRAEARMIQGEWRVVPEVWGLGKACTSCVGTSALKAFPQASACGKQLLAASLASLLGCRV